MFFQKGKKSEEPLPLKMGADEEETFSCPDVYSHDNVGEKERKKEGRCVTVVGVARVISGDR